MLQAPGTGCKFIQKSDHPCKDERLQKPSHSDLKEETMSCYKFSLTVDLMANNAACKNKRRGGPQKNLVDLGTSIANQISN